MDNVYTYDKVNNILSLENKAPVPASNLMGGSSVYTYNYDDLYRLTSASGSYKGANEEHTYSLSMSYNSVGGIISKNQIHKKKDQEQKKTTYNLSYAYGDTQPHAPIHIGEQTYEYDANGNQTGWTSDVSGQRRVVLWDEENRIRSIYDNGSQHHYIYDASGERVIKGKTTGQRIFVNGEWKAGSGEMGNYTVYVNPYVVLNSGGYTKHYYIEGQRIVSKLGGGWDNNGQGSLKAGNGKVDYVGRHQKVFDGIVKNLKFLGADGQILTAGKSGKVPPGQVNGTGNIAEAFRYFFHPDHLGSTSYVTDASGEVFQHLEYIAFGETFVEEHSNTDRTPYLFNGKELDEETGLYYYGARYYDPRITLWLSVDPMVEKYPAISGYTFTLNNPLSVVDPDGADVYIIVYDSQKDSRFESAAKTREREIMEQKGFDPKKDHVYMIDVSDLGKVEGEVKKAINDAKEKGYGKTVEASFYTHGGMDGPTGGVETSGDYNLAKETGWALDGNQLSPDGWKNIDWNFDEKRSIASFYGCQTAGFAENFFSYSNVAFTAGQDMRVGPTYRLDEWSSAWFPGSDDNVYYSGASNGVPSGIPVYSRTSFKTNEYGTFRIPLAYIMGNATINGSKPTSASVKEKK
jgi:RHS repeat-associated protein